MALSGVIDLPGGQGQKLQIEFKNSGQELYWMDGILIQEISAAGNGKSHIRKIPFEGYDIELRYSFSGKQSFADLYIDGSLYRKDIFSMQKVIDGTDSSASSPFRIVFILVGILILLAWILWES